MGGTITFYTSDAHCHPEISGVYITTAPYIDILLITPYNRDSRCYQRNGVVLHSGTAFFFSHIITLAADSLFLSECTLLLYLP